MIDVAKAVIDYKATQIKSYPVNANRASEAGHPCERYLVLVRTRWQERQLHSVTTQFIFDGGNMIEKLALRELEDAGFGILEQQRAFSWPELQLTGHIDCKLVMPNEADHAKYGAVPTEIKGLNQYDWEKVNSVEDFLNSPKVWLRKYPAQVMLYCLMDNKELGLLHIKNKLTYVPKSIWVELDYDYAEGICKKLERVNQHVADGTLPEQTDDTDICQHCDFFHVCLPEIRNTALEFNDDPELADDLARLMELKTAKAEHDALDRKLKPRLEGVEKAIIGDFLVTGKWIEVSERVTPAAQQWRKKITPLIRVEAEV